MDASHDQMPRLDEVHIYFPEWADRPSSSELLLEAENNSYLAGGYSEEFGYQRHNGSAPAFPPLSGESERSGLWNVQIGCLHPGYPECARSQDRDHRDSGPSKKLYPADASEQMNSPRIHNQLHHSTRNSQIIHVGQLRNRHGILWYLGLFTRRWRIYMGRRAHLRLR